MSLKFKYAHSIHGVIRIMSVEKLEVDYNSMQMNVQEFINFTLHYIVDLDIPIKRSVGWKLKYTILMF